MFDEMSLKEHLQYDSFHDHIVGYEDLGNSQSSSKLANHALVFMAQGIFSNWKQPLPFYFSNGPIASQQLQPILMDVLDACFKHNLEVVACISDLGTNNVKTFKNLGVTVKKPHFLFQSKKIFCMFDPPHLLKSFRNLFRKYPLRLPVSVGDTIKDYEARWDHILMTRDIDAQRSIGPHRALCRITDAHLQPSMQQTMKVRLAAQVFSRTVSTYMFTLIMCSKLDSLLTKR